MAMGGWIFIVWHFWFGLLECIGRAIRVIWRSSDVDGHQLFLVLRCIRVLRALLIPFSRLENNNDCVVFGRILCQFHLEVLQC